MRRWLIVSLALAFSAVWGGERQPNGAAIASAHPLATEAGFEILTAGGNAVDAAIAVSAALAVVEPYASGMGGGGFWLIRNADGSATMVDGREVAPAAAHRDMYLDDNRDPLPGLSVDGPLAAGIPGLPAGLAYMAERYGRLPLARSLAPAIRHAENGFPAHRRFLLGLRFKQRAFMRWPAGAALFFPGGQPPELGTLFRQPELARVLRALAAEGAAGFYQGPVADSLVSGVRDAGGIWSKQDLKDYAVKEREPLVGEYLGTRVITAPPPSSGGVALINMLNILAGFDVAELDEPTRKHLLVEVMRRAFRDRAEFLGDPDFVDVPVERLLHPFYAAGQRASLRLDRATTSDNLPGITPASSSGGTQTTHFSVLDAEGNAVAGTQSLNFYYGSGFVAPGTGVLLNNEMDDFSIKEGIPNGYQLVGARANAIEPKKRMLSSMTPTILTSDRGLAVLGSPGGSRIISMVLLGTLAWHGGKDAKFMVERPRFHHQYFPDEVTYEQGAFSEAEVAALEAMGHRLKESRRTYGNMQVVTWDFSTGDVDAASDPRAKGNARIY